MGIYWVRGQLDRDPAIDPTTPLENREAILFPSTGDPLNADMSVITLTDVDGKFFLNPFYNINFPITFEVDFYAAAVKRGGDNFGANAVSFALEPVGYNDVNLILAEGAGPGETELEDTGWIRLTNITREGEDLVLTWGYDPAPGRGPTDVQIYAFSAVDAVFSDSQTFPALDGVPSGTTTYRHVGVAHDGNNTYYRVVPSSASVGDMFLDENNSISVGKVETLVPANKYVFTALPFQEDLTTLSHIVMEQLGSGGEFLWWDGVGYHGATYTGTWTGTDRDLRIGEGFIVRAQADSSVALTGRFGTVITPYVRNLPASNYNLIAYPYPQTKLLADMGVSPSSGDDLLKWLVDSQAYDGATYNAGWVGPAGIDDLELARPRYFRSSSEQDWTITF